MIDSLTKQANCLSAHREQLVKKIIQLKHLLVVPPTSWLPLQCEAIITGIPREVFVDHAGASDDTSSCSSLSAPSSPSLVGIAPSPELPVNFECLPPASSSSTVAVNYLDDHEDDLLELPFGDDFDSIQELLADDDLHDILMYPADAISSPTTQDWDSDEYSDLLDGFDTLI